MSVTRNDSDSGAAAVEFALLLPLLLLIFMGIIDFGRAFNAQVTLNHAAREGVRVYALTGDSGAAATRTEEAAAPMLDPVGVGVTGCSAGAPTTLTASYEFDYITPISALMGLVGAAGLTSPINLTAEATARCSG